MKNIPRNAWLFGAWAIAVFVVGGVLTSYHQPFQIPEAQVLASVLAKNAAAGDATGPRWRATHLLSGGCGCSRRIMLHLLDRRMLGGVTEQIVMVDGEESYLPGTADTLASLRRAGFGTSHVAYREISAQAALHGIPLLMVTSPEGKVAYLGGYGTQGDRDEEILRQVRAGSSVASLPVLGCAIGSKIRRASDPFRLKY